MRKFAKNWEGILDALGNPINEAVTKRCQGTYGKDAIAAPKMWGGMYFCPTDYKREGECCIKKIIPVQARIGITDDNRWLLIVLGVVILWFANKKYKFI